MNKYLWQSDSDEQVDKTIMEFMAGEDIILDRELFPFDIRATAAHVRGLQRIDVLSSDESWMNYSRNSKLAVSNWTIGSKTGTRPSRFI